MKLKLPTRRRRTPWGALCWGLPMAYVFWDPLHRGASWLEWTLTALAFAIFAAMYVVGVAYWYDRRTVALVCAGTTLLAIVFYAFRFSGSFFFAFVAAFVPLAAGGHLLGSAALILGVLSTMWLEWWLLGLLGVPPSNAVAPMIVSIEGILIGAGTTFAARLERANERDLRAAERERIARDLHDVLGHTLSSVALKAELAGRLFDASPQRALAEINDVERIAREALDEVRQAIHGYYAGDIQDEFKRAESMLRAAGIQIERRLEPIVIDPAHERVLALAMREAVTNVVRHARASLCRLSLYKAEASYRLEIADDGRHAALAEGIGMRSIRARVEALGGKAAWHTQTGTQLIIDLPLTLGGDR